MIFRSILLLGCCLMVWTTSAQTNISLEQLVETALSNNYNIKIAKNNIEFSSVDASIGAAGFLPTVDLSAGYTYSNSNVNTTFSGNIPDQNIQGAASQNYNAGVNLRYTIFDGLKPVFKLKKAKVDVQLSNTQYQQQVENTVYTVIQAYYNWASLQEDYRIAKEKMTLTKAQLDRVNTKREFGQGSEIERLNLQTTFNADSTQLLRLQLGIRQAVRQLNRTLGTEFVPDDATTTVNTDLTTLYTLEAIQEAAKQSNLTIRAAEQNVARADLDYKIIKTELYPKLTTTISYGLNGSNNDAGIVNTSTSFGPSINLGLSYNIYGAGAVNRAKKQNEINIQNQALNLELATYEVEQNAKDVYTQYQNNLALIPLEEQNAAISKANFDRTTAAYELGQATFLDYQQAQFNYIQAQQRIISAKYQAKLSEWEIRRLTSTLAK